MVVCGEFARRIIHKLPRRGCQGRNHGKQKEHRLKFTRGFYVLKPKTDLGFILQFNTAGGFDRGMYAWTKASTAEGAAQGLRKYCQQLLPGTKLIVVVEEGTDFSDSMYDIRRMAAKYSIECRVFFVNYTGTSTSIAIKRIEGEVKVTKETGPKKLLRRKYLVGSVAGI